LRLTHINFRQMLRDSMKLTDVIFRLTKPPGKINTCYFVESGSKLIDVIFKINTCYFPMNAEVIKEITTSHIGN